MATQDASSLPGASDWLCPITQDLPIEPVVASDGFLYDGPAIRRWIAVRAVSPMTNRKISKVVLPCFKITQQYNAWRAANGLPPVAMPAADVPATPDVRPDAFVPVALDDVEAQRSSNDEALLRAVRSGDGGEVRRWAAAGGNVNMRVGNGSLLRIPVRNGHGGTVDALLAAGAQPGGLMGDTLMEAIACARSI